MCRFELQQAVFSLVFRFEQRQVEHGLMCGLELWLP